ncbi:MAG: PASTA domain-containing protein [Oscillospiraceae bacterium]|nr:PASTA domain-containing protein [Oscillospiraceae bacterium]
MSFENKIRQAYDSVHAPDTLTERLREELQRDLRQDADAVGGIVTEAPKRDIVRTLLHGGAFVAATVILCGGFGFALWSMRDKTVVFHPGSNVSAPADEQVVMPEMAGLSRQTAQQTLEALGLAVEFSGDGSTVARSEPPAGARVTKGSTVRLVME